MTSGRAVSLTPREREIAEQRRALILADVKDGLSRPQRELSPKYFYDQRGSQLFEEITRLPEYYLTRAEREILLARVADIVSITNARTLVELGAGSAAKTRILLAAMRSHALGVTYIPVDVSEEFLRQTGRALQRELPSLIVEPVVSDISISLDLPPGLHEPVLFAFLGSTIGNFDDAGAISLLRRVRAHMQPRDWFLLGTDLRKDRDTIEAAYDDSAGVTAEFNRNMLRTLNAELGADFVPERWAHRSFYNDEQHRVEMHLISMGAQTVRIAGMPDVSFADGESIRTELSYKYDRASVDALAAKSELVVAHWFVDAEQRFALSLLEARP